ncbi:MAG TPA: hypothetical protein PKN95_13665 [Verrucomicrobiota bacterium]|nr:hypothetical protein [Verrucomicrobiota bacterium]HNT13357.1 hypothetical protein [Verrucomicrobiota bacterium]
MRCLRFGCAGLLLIAAAEPAIAFNGHAVTTGPLRLTIGAIPTVRSLEATQAVRVTLTNHAAETLSVELELKGWVSPCLPVGRTRATLALPGHGSAAEVFSFKFGAGAYSAMYPLHVYARFHAAGSSTTLTAHAVRIFETQFEAADGPARDEEAVAVVPAFGGLALTQLQNCRPVWQRHGEAPHWLPAGWEGCEPESLAFFERGVMARGRTRASLNVHPPYRGGTGPLFLEYPIKLPPARELRLRFFNAIRDVAPPEPPSDGVTFRVWVGDEKIFERHTASTVWVPGEADLSRWAGQTIKLRLEAHPGPRLDPTCDSSFWGDPILLADAAARTPESGDFPQRAARARTSVTGGSAGAGTYVFALADGLRAAVAPGANGLLDAALAFGSESGAVVLQGFDLSLEGGRVGVWESAARVEKIEVIPADRRLEIRHHLQLQREFDRHGKRAAPGVTPAILTATLWADGPGLRVQFSSDARLTDVGVGPADQSAAKVYFGHGYVVEEPGKFTVHGGGHELSTRHVGCDFTNGVALLQACDTPPDWFQVEPGMHLYSLHTHPAPTFTFVPGRRGAMNCALQYRTLHDQPAAPAVAQKAGRLVFDLWGGSYRDNAAALQRCFDYGLTNSLAIIHVWQRWGYDYRLPDIFPPQPQLGTPEELRELGELCTRAGALWGLHDNYIDFYPDAEGFSYDHITFDAAGQPRRGWLNEGRNAQAWQFRPDHVQPFLQRNLRWLVPALQPTAAFVDVWTSLNAFDYFDRDGRWHSKMETLRHWGEAFAQIRTAVGHGPTLSEAGSDQLIGWLDGADCQWLQLQPRGEPFSMTVPCADWERVPWFDLVHHTRFSLHGAGYSNRYQGNRSRDEHGIESDDYLGIEVLAGHALMADLPMLSGGAIRKYWLLQPFAEAVAHADIAAVENPGGDLHRLLVRWTSGATAWVNRGTNDWEITGHTLPPYGFVAQAGPVVCSVEKIGGRVIEQSRAGPIRYVNARPPAPETLAIRPTAERLEPLGGRNFRLVTRWDAVQPAPKDLRVFYHFRRPTPGRYTDTEFYGGGDPEIPTSAWQGGVLTGTNWMLHVPENYPLGEYEILCGLYDAQGDGTRYRLIGEPRPTRRYALGVLHVEGEVNAGQTNVTKIYMTAAPNPPRTLAPVPSPQRVDFGPVQTTRGLRLIETAADLTIVPLPDQPAFAISLNLDSFHRTPAEVGALRAVDARGNRARPIAWRLKGSSVTFSTHPADFGYCLDWKTGPQSLSNP